MTRRAVAVLLVAALLLSPVVSATSAEPASGSDASIVSSDVTTGTDGEPDSARRVEGETSTQAAQEGSSAPTIGRTMTLSLTPDRPGSIDVTAKFSVPENLRSLQTTLPANSTVTATNGFSKNEGTTYEWDSDTRTPSLTFRVPANRTGFGTRRLAGDTAPRGGSSAGARDVQWPVTDRRTAQKQYSFVDTGSWAIVAVPQLGTRWSWVGTGSVTLDKRVEIAGAGATGGEIAFLGRHTIHTRAANGQTIRLVVPRAASMRESPAAVLDSVTTAGDLLRVGARDDEVFFVAAPTSVRWAAQGIEYGGSDAWIRADARLDIPGNVWIHEYVHTRQDYETTESTLWTVEASAEYYSALLTLRQGRIDFSAFRDHLARGTRTPYRDALLANPNSWPYLANYLKGALVYGTLDRRIRLATNSSRTMNDVLRRMNERDEPVNESFFLTTVSEIGSQSVRDAAQQYTTTTATPDPWTNTQHQRAFATLPPRMEYQISESTVSGPYRNESADRPVTLVPGERFSVTALVSNVGGTTGTYETELLVNGSVVDATTGQLGAEENATVTLSHRFESTGVYPVMVAGREFEVTVRDPSTPTVTELTVSPTTVRAGDQAEVHATVRNSADRPANGELAVLADGTEVATWTPRLNVGGQANRSFIVTFNETGTHQIQLGNRTTTVTVQSRTTSTTTPGFDTKVTVLVVIAAAFVVLRD